MPTMPAMHFATSTVHFPGTVPDSAFLDRAAALALRFHEDAAQRDREGGTPRLQVDWLKQAGLPSAQLESAYGGADIPWLEIMQAVRLIARTDGSLAHLYGYHHLPLHLIRTRGTERQRGHLLGATARGNLFWGNSDNAMTRNASGRRTDSGWILNGSRPFVSGTHVADWMVTSWYDASEQLWFAAIPMDREGISIAHDWDGIGQRQTGSGSLTFSDVRVDEDEVIGVPGQSITPFASLTSLMQQSVLLNVFVGSAQGALEEAAAYTRAASRPWIHSGVESHVDDPWVRRQYGDLYIKTLAASDLADQAARLFDEAYRQGPALDEAQRGRLAVELAAANVYGGEVALEVCEQVFEVMGARSATRRLGFDRFWRNVRVHTLHNPAEYKKRTVGDWVLQDAFPVMSRYR